jgi:hypothetical protein
LINCRRVNLDWPKQYRLIPSHFPVIDLFEAVADKEDFRMLQAIESLTNPRITQFQSHAVSSEDWVQSSVVMAAFTYLGKKSRFSDGSYGVYYASRDEETAIYETIFHRERFLECTNEAPGEISMRVYVGEINEPQHDIRNKKNQSYLPLHDPDPNNYTISQQFGSEYRAKKSWGIVYRSVRHNDGECIAVLRPPAVTKPRQGKHYSYVWNGKRITGYYQKLLPKPIG